MEFITGDLIDLANDGYFDVIVHGCNCFHKMGSGIAKQLVYRWPEILQTDKRTLYGCTQKLGTYSSTQVKNSKGRSLIIINAYTQFTYSREHVVIDYDACAQVAKKIAKDFPSARIGMPRIGAGLSGGSWDVLLPIFTFYFEGMDVTCVDWDK